MKTVLQPLTVYPAFLILAALANAATPGAPAPGATGLDPDAVVLNWTPEINEAEVKVFLSPFVKPNSYDLKLDVRSSPISGVVSGTFSSLRPNTVYYWKVNGLNASGTTVNTGTHQSFTTGSPDPLKPVLIYPSPTPMPTPAPSDPDDKIFLETEPPPFGKLKSFLTWSGTHPKASYNVYFGKRLDKEGPKLVGNVVPTAGICTFSLGQLERNMQYYCRADLVETEFGTVVKTGRMWTFWTGSAVVPGYTDPDTILFADEFENTTPSGNPASRTEVPDLGWERQDSSVQARDAGYIGTRCVKLGGATKFSNSVSTMGMKDIRIRFFRKTSLNQSLSLEWSVNSGTTWRDGGTVLPNRPYTDGLQEFSVQDAYAANKPNLIFRFSTTNSAAAEYAYLDGVQVVGRAHHFPAPDGDGPRIGTGTNSVIFLGDSLTSNSGSEKVGNVDYHWTGVINDRFGLGLDVIIEDTDSSGQAINPERHDNLGKGGSIATKYNIADPDTFVLPAIKTNDDESSGGLERLRVELEYRANNPLTKPMPKFVIINFGTNDHKLYGVPAHEGEPVVDPIGAKSSDEVFRDNLKVIINLVRSVGAKPILVIPHDFVEGPVPGGDVNTAPINDYLSTYYGKFAPRMFGNLPYYGTQKFVTPSGDGGALLRFHKFTDQIRKLVDDEDYETLDIIDVNTKALEYDGEQFTVEGGVHLSPLGHQIYAETIGNYLEDRYGGTSAP